MPLARWAAGVQKVPMSSDSMCITKGKIKKVDKSIPKIGGITTTSLAVAAMLPMVRAAPAVLPMARVAPAAAAVLLVGQAGVGGKQGAGGVVWVGGGGGGGKEAEEAPPPPPRDPLVLDLDGDGIETTSVRDGTVIVFDHDADGVKTGTGWVRPDDGWL